MGNSSARNILDSYTNAMISVANNVIQDCDVTANSQQQIFINNCGQVLIQDFNIARTLNVDSTCVQSSISTNNIDQQLTQIATQMATAINNNLNLTGTATADNITNLSINLSTAIRNEAAQNCSSLFGVRQSINIDCSQSPFPRATVSGIKGSTTGDIITNCLQQSNNVNNIKQQLQVIIDQKASATVENGLIFIIYLVVGIILFYFIMKVNIWMAFVALILSIIAYFVTAYLFELFPFDQRDSQ